MSEIPNLAGVATKNLVDKIGTGRFEASYINWARTVNLLHQHAPGWVVDYVPSPDGGILHKAPKGGYLLIAFKNIDGTMTPAIPQAVMDNRNKSIDYENISSRDISDTQRRGMCMAAAMTFGLAFELWAKMPMESGYAGSTDDQTTSQGLPKNQTTLTTTQATAEVAKVSEVSEQAFRAKALEIGVNTNVIDILVEKLGGKFTSGIETLQKTTAEALNKKYATKSVQPASGAGW